LAFDLGSLELLTVPINDEIDKLPLLKKFVYLLTLWFACTYPLTAPDGEFAVFTLNSINKRYLKLKYFDKSKTSYRFLDDFVTKRKWATSRSSGGRTYYKITDEGTRTAVQVLEEFRKIVAVENEDIEQAGKQWLEAKPEIEQSMREYPRLDPLTFYRILQMTQEKVADIVERFGINPNVLGPYKRIIDDLHITEDEARESVRDSRRP
jgi:hypothetical protein